MRDESIKQLTLDERITIALEKCPEISIPHDFAARVAAKVPTRKSLPLRTSYYGRNVMLISVVILFALLLAFSHPHHSTIEVIIEWCFCAQFIALAVWLGIRRWHVG
ncbi:MAG TPA: hypothetical protein VFE38_08750 [Edaphobacter sp.]|nr:hypothetical protein [Edaphobacter sp.]